MTLHTSLSNIVTSEQRAKQLGATVVFHRHEAVAQNFPTESAANLFWHWLKEHGYYTNRKDAHTVGYVAPIATSNVVLLSSWAP